MAVLTMEAVVMMEACDELDDDDVGHRDGGMMVVADGAKNDDSDCGSSGGGDGAGDNNDCGCNGSIGSSPGAGGGCVRGDGDRSCGGRENRCVGDEDDSK